MNVLDRNDGSYTMYISLMWYNLKYCILNGLAIHKISKLKRIITCFIILFNNVIVTWAQIPDGTALPSSTGTSAIARNIDIPVDLSTGRANVQIPLYSAGFSKMQIPVTISYQTSGIKVTDIATWVGLGWNLSAGGRITRIVRGHPDEKGYLVPGLNTSLQFLLDNVASWDYGLFDFYYNEQSNAELDGQPDIFYFEIPGKSGMFVLAPNGEAHTIPYQDIEIERINNTYFTIRDENGNKFIFGDSINSRETIQQTIVDTTDNLEIFFDHPLSNKYDVKTKTVDYVSTWHLTKAMDCNGDCVSFTYDTLSSYEYEDYNVAALLDVNVSTKQNTRKFDYLRHIKTKERPAYLKEIVWRGGKLEFITEARYGVLSGARQLRQIKLYSIENKCLKNIVFSYGEFTNGSLKLTGLREEAGTLDRPICTFFYNTSVNIPARHKAGFDHWGYYNGTTSELRQLPSCNIDEVSLDGVSRSPNVTYAKASILEAILFPNGARKELEYELNQGALYYNSTQIQAGGLRIKQIKESESSTSQPRVTSYEYVTEYGQPSGVLLFDKPRYYEVALKEMNNGVQHWWATIFSRSGNSMSDASGTTVFYTSVKVVQPDSSYCLTKFNNAHDEYGYMASIPDGGTVNSRFEQDMSGFILNTSNSWMRVPIEKASYTKNGELLSKQTNEYIEDTKNRKVIDAYLFVALGAQDPIRGRFLGRYRYISSPYRLARTRNYTTKYELESEIRYMYGESPLRPIETITYTAGSDTLRTKVKYSSDFGDLQQYNGNDTMLLALKAMQYKGMNAIPIEQVTEKNGKIVEAQLSMFRILFDINDAIVPHKNKKIIIQKPLSSGDFDFSEIDNGQFKFDSHYKDEKIVDKYDQYLNVIQSHNVFGNTKAVIYGYEGTLPVAEIDNAQVSCNGERTNEVIYTSFEDMDDQFVEQNFSKTGRKICQGVYKADISDLSPGTYIVSYWIKDNATAPWRFVKETFTVQENLVVFNKSIGTATSYIDELRIYPQDARMVSYTYDPGIGKTSETDINDRSTYTQYDAFGRVIEIRDNNQHKRTSYEYYD